MKRFLIIITLVVSLVPSAAWSSDGISIPPYLIYQSQLYDEGGNPIADGDVEVEFRISDAQGVVLHEERQSVEVVRGGVSALIGSGVDDEGVPVGGLSIGALDPEGPRYIEVQVDGMPATEPMEIASVPYAIYASKAMGVATGAIDSLAIKDGGVEFGDLSDGLMERLGQELSRDGAAGGLVSQGYLEGQSGAASVGVAASFTYSGANNLQGVLSDFDRAIKMRDEKANSSVEVEELARTAADSAETAARISADSAETASRTSADNAEAAARVANTNRIVALEGVVGSITTPPERPEYKVRAWGAGVFCGLTAGDSHMSGGGNVTVDVVQGVCRISFSHPMPSANYVVNVTSSEFLTTFEKSGSGFSIRKNEFGTNVAFDFTVVGP
jgi:hypothetical protein